MTKPMTPCKRRRKYRRNTIYRISYPHDGITVNRIAMGNLTSPYRFNFTHFDNPHVYVKTAGSNIEVGIIKSIGRINRYKSFSVNGDLFTKINRKAFN